MAAQRTILITGASRGIGLAAARHFATAGLKVVGVARSTAPDGFPGTFHRVDLSADDLAARMAAIVAETPVDILVNNAGSGRMAHLGAVRLDDLDAIIRLNLTATMLATQACLPHMRAQGWGRVVNVSSRAALGKDGRTVYGATKAGLFGFTRTWALELAAEGVTVNCVGPGPIETEMFREHNAPGSPTAQTVVGAIPVRRMGQPEEVVSALAFFAGEHAGFTTGQVLYVCGGLTIARDPI